MSSLMIFLIKIFIIHPALYLTSIEGYTEQGIFYLYTTTLPYHGYLVSVTFSPISRKPCYQQICIIYILERLIYSASAHVCCIKIHAEIKELLQVKD